MKVSAERISEELDPSVRIRLSSEYGIVEQSGT